MDKLRYFLAVAEHLNFGQAARQLHMTQPPLSRQIKNLEEELGVRLFFRTKRQVSLTPAGEALAAGAHRLVQQWAELQTQVSQIDKGQLGTLKIGFVSTANYGVLPPLVRRFSNRWPKVDIQLQELTGDQQVQALQHGQIDVGLMYRDFPDNLTSKAVHQESYVAVVPREHRLAPSLTLACRELAGEDFVFIPRHLSPNLYDAVLSLTQAAGFSPQIRQQARQMQTVIGLVAAGMGVSIVPAGMAQLGRDDVCYRSLVPETSLLTTYAVWSGDNPSSVLAAFLGETP